MVASEEKIIIKPTKIRYNPLMDIQKIYSQLISQFPDIEIHQNHPLAPYTTVKIGGAADIFIHTKNSKDFINVLKYLIGEDNVFSARKPPKPSGEGASTVKNIIEPPKITIIGNGSNVLISDTGIRGIVIKNSSTDFQILNTVSNSTKTNKTSTNRTENDPTKYLNFGVLDYDESDKPKVLVKINSGCNLPQIINQLIDQGITGLQWFGFIPGSIGGAVFCNIHGGAYNFSNFVESVEVFDLKTSTSYELPATELNWSYDFSSFQKNPNLIILSVTLSLFKGDTAKAKETVVAWVKQKSAVQSMNSLGSVFKNPPLEICQKNWGEQKSTGWIIDIELKLKGHSIGDAQISPRHANFILNNGHSTAADYLALIKLIQSQMQTKFNFQFELEIKLLGEF